MKCRNFRSNRFNCFTAGPKILIFRSNLRKKNQQPILEFLSSKVHTVDHLVESLDFCNLYKIKIPPFENNAEPWFITFSKILTFVWWKN